MNVITIPLLWGKICALQMFLSLGQYVSYENSNSGILGVYFVCEYFCWMLGDPHFFFGRSLPFLIVSLLRAQERPATLILTVTSGLCITRVRHVYNRDTETGS